MRFNKKHDNQSGDSDDNWLTTYSDLVTLLLAFFVLLFSFSEIDAQKWQELVKAFSGDLIIQETSSTDSILENNPDIMDENTPVRDESILDLERFSEEELDDEISEIEEEEASFPIEVGDPEEEGDEGNQWDEDYLNEQFESLYQELLIYNDLEGLEMEITRTDTEIKLRLSNNMLFAPERADITISSREALREITLLIKSYDETLDEIIMEGNTDNLPLTTGQFRDNFELSLMRALSVLYFFRYEADFEPHKLVPMGYGEFNPVAGNDTEDGRAKNRRTDIILVRMTHD